MQIIVDVVFVRIKSLTIVVERVDSSTARAGEGQGMEEKQRL
jgi:hypothetical protein